MTSDATDQDAQKGGVVNETVEIIKTVVYALLIALVLRIFLFQPYTIPSASMEPNLFQGDYIIVSKYSYGYSRHSIPFSPKIFSGRLFDHAEEFTAQDRFHGSLSVSESWSQLPANGTWVVHVGAIC